MCGIAGIVDLAGRDTPEAAVLARMAAALAHRGPDGEGIVALPGVGLVHRRLAIVDLATGAQPMTSADGALTVTFNGEIYNHQGLRAELEALGHRFRTASDTEALLVGWRAWGRGLLDRLRGMFAFALWDAGSETLLLARDRLGERPLYWARDARGRLAFASEIQALLPALPGVPAIDPQALADYLAFGYVPDPKAIWQGVAKLAPGHLLELGRGRPWAEPVRWWRPRLAARHAGSLDDLAAELRARLGEAVRAQMMADVPLGAFLSGGVDSSGVVALMAGASDRPVVTCTMGSPDPAVDETAWAGLVAARYGTDHTAETVAVDALGLLDTVTAAMGEPFADPSALPTWLVARLARRRVTVALSGDGGDELLAGYRRYPLHVAEERVKALLPAGLRRAVLGPLARAFPKLDRAPRWLRAKATLEALAADTARGWLRAVTPLPESARARVLAPGFLAGLGGYDPAEVIRRHLADADTDDPLARAQHVDLLTWLPGRMLVKVDRAAMAHGLEVRPPLLDAELVEWATGLPAAAKLRGFDGKRVLKRALAPLVPEPLLTRPKRGFTIPLAAWLRQGLGGRLAALQRDGRLADAGVVDPAGLARVADEHGRGSHDHGQLLWALLVLDAFLARHHAGVPAAQPLPALAA